MKVIESLCSDRAYFFYRGRVALYAILKSMGIGKDDEVLLQAFTCLAVPLPIINLGAIPVYIDIDENTFNMNPDLIEAKITEKTKAIVVQHTFGIPAEMKSIVEIAKKHNLYIIEDCCHTIGSTFEGREVGTFGDAAFYSFEWGKPIIVGVGGMAIVNNHKIKNKMDKLYSTFRRPSLNSLIIIELEYILHHFLALNILYWIFKDLYGFLSRIGVIVGTFKKEEFEGLLSDDYSKIMFSKHKNRLLKKLSNVVLESNAKKYSINKIISELDSLNIQRQYENTDESIIYLKYPLLFNNKKEILKQARKKNIELSDIFKTPIHPLENEDLKLVGYHKSMCPTAEKISESIVSISIKTRMGSKYIKKTMKFLKKYGCQQV